VKIIVLLRRLIGPPGRPEPGLLGACEAAALRAAVRLQAACPGSSLTALAVGPPRDDAALAPAAALGARTVRLWNLALEGADYDAYARAIAATCRLLKYDLVLCGERSAEEGLGVIGPATAEHLGIPHLSAACDIAWQPSGRLRVERGEGTAARRLEAAPPLLVTVAASCAVGERLAPAGAGGPVELFDLDKIGLLPEELRHRQRFEGTVIAPPRPRAEILPDVATLAQKLRESR